MGAQPSSGKGGGAAGAASVSGSPLRNPGAASFSPAPEYSDTPSRKSTKHWARRSGSRSGGPSGDLESGGSALEEGALHTVHVDVDPEDAVSSVRQPSKMSVQSIRSLDERVASKSAKADSRPSSAKADSRPASSKADSRPTSSHSYSRSGSFSQSRPTSASSQQGIVKATSNKDPELMRAERLAKLSLESLEKQVVSREAWGGYTPSTASPNFSRAASSVSSSTCGSRPASSAAVSVTSSLEGKDPNVKQNLKDARLRAKASSQALLAELMGSAGATPARYSTWPAGCAVRVGDDLFASLVSYDKHLNTFVIRLDDDSTRTVHAHQVSRARARDRISAQGNSSQVQQSRTIAGPDAQGKDHSFGVVTDAAGYSKAPRVKPMHLEQAMPGQAFDFEGAPSSPGLPEPRVLGRMQLLS